MAKRLLSSVSTVESPILFQRMNNSVRVSLNRPKALNSLNIQMCIELKEQLLKWKESGNNIGAFIVTGAGEKAFCAGGDVKSVWQEITTQDKETGTGEPGLLSADFFREEYEMNYLLGTSPIPQISIWNGIVMGGGVGVSVLGKFRVATENVLFAMPETAIGLFPDVGSSAWLPHLRGGFGKYVGLTGCRLGAPDLVGQGIATHFVKAAHLEELVAAIEGVASPDPLASTSRIAEVLDDFHFKSGEPSSKIPTMGIHHEAISRVFGEAETIEEIVSNLQREAASSSSRSAERLWARDTLKLLNKMSPTSLKVTLAQLSRGRALGGDLARCLDMEFRLVQRCLVKGGDFTEGIRAVLVDKDHNPRWSPAALGDVTDEAVDRFFAPLGPGGQWDLHLLEKFSISS